MTPRGVPIPPRPRLDRRDSGVTAAVWGKEKYLANPRGVPIPPRPRLDRRDSGVTAAVWGKEKYLGVTSCPPSRTPYTRDLTIFYISTLSMLFDVCDQSCWQSCVTPVEIRVDVLVLCTTVF